MPKVKPKSFAFVLMPFDKAFDEVYKEGIKPACKAAGVHCERVDEQFFEETILQRIYDQITVADLIISDMTGRNANVFYETGYAHALGKKVILLTGKIDDIPFDLKHHQHIVYEGNIPLLRQLLRRRVSWYSKQIDASVSEPASKLELYIEGQRIIEETEVLIPKSDYW